MPVGNAVLYTLSPSHPLDVQLRRRSPPGRAEPEHLREGGGRQLQDLLVSGRRHRLRRLRVHRAGHASQRREFRAATLF